MAQLSHLWSRGLVWVFLTSAGILLVSATQPNGRIRSQRAVAMAAYSLSTEITNFEFSNSLLDSSSNYYNYLKSLVDFVFIQAYNISINPEGHFLGTTDMSFTEGKHIHVETTILFSLSPSTLGTIVVRNELLDFMLQTSSSPIQINPIQTFVNETTVPITTRSPTTSRTTTTEASRSNSEPASLTPHSMSPHRQDPTGAATNHTTPLHNNATDWTSTAPGVPNTVHSTSSVSKPLVPYWLDWVPGWGIALLVLASLILLLLIILIILLLLRWCCMDEPEKEPQPRYDPYSHEPYSSHSPAKSPTLKHMGDPGLRTPEKPRGTSTGMYVVNP
ncbi:uncharacterized protein LOC121695750 [Alosa sapidissima]|uniref:uncharacterized protein LOC121695750 n=1 Tax=Alosa sapidissima TaxID=34773 RepID=UPI001C093218|nr:uncharacterized protein LOC121695750 [Alosa sapidissima]